MRKISIIGSLLKKIYRAYSTQLLNLLEARGFTDLRPSFLDILLFICDNEGPSIKEIGHSCALKKQTMTSHLNELEKRGYIKRVVGERDKREQNIFLTTYGEKFKLSLFECVDIVENEYINVLGEVELERTEHLLQNFYGRILSSKNNELPLS